VVVRPFDLLVSPPPPRLWLLLLLLLHDVPRHPPPSPLPNGGWSKDLAVRQRPLAAWALLVVVYDGFIHTLVVFVQSAK
jgi:hypothetical protein